MIVPEFIIVLNDGKTYSSIEGVAIYRVKDDKFHDLTDNEVAEGVEKGYLSMTNILENRVIATTFTYRWQGLAKSLPETC